MRSLFARILLWFLATVTITATGLVVTTAITMREGRNTPPPFARTVPFLLGEARTSYEQGGAEKLKAFLDHVRTVFQAEPVFTDNAGRDLATGEDRSDLLRDVPRRTRIGRRSWFTLGLFRPRFALGRPSEDGRYWFFLVLPQESSGFAAFLPQHLWIITAALLLCYWLAIHLTRPVLRLQQTMEKFGAGDLSARAGGAARKDELGSLARSFNNMAGRIQTLLDSQRRLLGDISHELRSPLARLGVAVELARSGENRDQALDRIQKEADRLNGLVGELLEVTRAEGDPSTMETETVNVDELLSEVVEASRIEADARGSRLEAARLAQVEVRADRKLLHRALENVIRNAIRYAPPGTAVEVSSERSVGRAVIRVRDYGPGVPEESLERIFDPFYRVGTDRDRSSGGVGLGLAIAQRAVAVHGGSIQARNASPGLEISIELPA